MKNKVLLIEHEKEEINQYQELLEKVGLTVDILEKFDLTELKNKLNNYYDIIITDAFFNHKERTSLTKDDSPGHYGLGKIIKTIREVDKQVVIIVNTQYNNSIETEGDLDEVNYVFDKNLNEDLFVWQIKQILKNEINSSLLSNYLVNQLNQLLKDKPSIIWRESMILMLQKYKEGQNEYDQMLAIKGSLNQLIMTCGFAGNNDTLLDQIIQQEILNIAGNPKKFGHLRHVVNVFWLGYYLINSEWPLIKNLADLIFPDVTEEKRLYLLNKSWLIASLFHDIGQLGEKINSVIDSINDLLSIYNSEPKKSVELKENGYEFPYFEVLKYKVAGEDLNLLDIFKSGFELKDHGILSALIIDQNLTISEEEVDEIKSELKQILKPALIAISFHNLFQKNLTNFKKYTSNFPLLVLLIFCDIIEVWDRETGYESMLTSDIKQIELYKINFEDEILNLTINYKLYKDVMNDNSILKAKNHLIPLIEKNIIPLFKIINNNIFKNKFRIQYTVVNSTNIIHRWPLPTAN